MSRAFRREGRPLPSTTKPSSVASISAPSAAQPVDHARDPIGLLVPELPGAGDHRPALREAAEQGDQRQLVDRQRAPPRGGRGSPSSVLWRATIAPRGSPPSVGSSSTSIAAPMRLRIPSSPTRVGFSPTLSRRTALPGTIVAATRWKAAEEKSPGTRIRPGSRRSAGRIVILRRGRR